MATKKQFQDHLIDNIIDFIAVKSSDTAGGQDYAYFHNNIFDLDLSNFRKTISTTGQVQTGTNVDNERVVIYQEDYQDTGASGLNEFVESMANCMYDETTNSFNIDWAWVDGQSEHWTLDLRSFAAAGSLGNYNVTTEDTAAIAVTITCTDGQESTFSLDLEYDVFDYLSQLISLENTSTTINPDLAEDILDTRIYELLPGGLTRQERINRLFSEFEELTGNTPLDASGIYQNPWNLDVDSDEIFDTWNTDIEANQDLYSAEWDITDPANKNDGMITRLDIHAEGTENEGKTLESLRNRINTYLSDIDKEIEPEIEDERPEFEETGPGYLKIRGLNQAIIVRNEEENDVGLIGSNPDNPDWYTNGFTIGMWVRFLDKTTGGTLFNFGAPMREVNPFGFMLETFVINKNDPYQDPTLGSTTWEEYIISNGWQDFFFQDTDYERFIRLVIRDPYTGALRDSHVGTSVGVEGYNIPRICTVEGEIDDIGNECDKITIPHAYDSMIGDSILEGTDYGSYFPENVLTHTRVPFDRREWYYIVANFNPRVNEYQRTNDCLTDGLECAPTGVNALSNFSDYWKWNVSYGEDSCVGQQPSIAIAGYNSNLNNSNTNCGETVDYNNIGSYTSYSQEGAKCKVEIISKTDLLLARGYKI